VSEQPTDKFVPYLVAGRLTKDTILPATGNPALGIPGGSALYAASGLALWNERPGLIARVPPGYPQEWVEAAARKGFDVRGIHRADEAFDERAFFAYGRDGTPEYGFPMFRFAERGLSFPQELLGYTGLERSPTEKGGVPLAQSLAPGDIPSAYLDAHAAHIGPLDLKSVRLLCTALPQGLVRTLTLDPDDSLLDPLQRETLGSLLNGLTALICSEDRLRSYFSGLTSDLWELAASLAEQGCEAVVVWRGTKASLLYVGRNDRRYVIPAYTVTPKDPTGAEDAFCGGFLAGYQKAFDFVEGCLYGAVSAAFAMEGTGPFYMLDALPGLAEHRLEALRGGVRRI
jgi:sugar/nucleoside kinase (ribokinase family)